MSICALHTLAGPDAAALHEPALKQPRQALNVLRSPGHSLDSEARAVMEPRFGRDFSDVRIHADSQAAASAEAVNARAYTVGSHIAFGSGQYAPGSPSGQRLLAHELTHVVQQSAAGAGPVLYRKANDNKPVQGAGVCDPKNLDSLGPEYKMSEVEIKKKSALKEMHLEKAAASESLYCPHIATAALRSLVPCTSVYLIGSNKGDGKVDVWARQPGETSLFWGFVRENLLSDDQPPDCLKVEIHGGNESTEDKHSRGTCGPEIGDSLADVLHRIRQLFDKWSDKDRKKSCMNLFLPWSAGSAWDIEDLWIEESDWLRKPPFAGKCGVPGAGQGEAVDADGSCANSVMVDGRCYLAGNVNYAAFGQMCQLCSDEEMFPPGVGTATGSDRDTMLDMIKVWKLGGVQGNLEAACSWAEAGWDGYPNHRGSPDDRIYCTGVCPVKTTRTFVWDWSPLHGRG